LAALATNEALTNAASRVECFPASGAKYAYDKEDDP
jgi:hypothetical protein